MANTVAYPIHIYLKVTLWIIVVVELRLHKFFQITAEPRSKIHQW